MTTTSRVQCRRPGCKGVLRSPESIARGMSVLCERRVRHAEATIAQSGAFSRDQRAKAAAAIRSGRVRMVEKGLYSVPSSRNDGTDYGTTASSCPCHAGAHDKRCWHLIIPIVADLTRLALAA